MGYPTLYTFRRCPYAIRGRMALSYSGIDVELREISLKSRPKELYSISPKGTVPVLELDDGTVIDQSIDIMMWSLDKSDPDGWLGNDIELQMEMVGDNDGDFKRWLDRYKYHDRYPESPMESYRDRCASYFSRYDDALADQRYLLGDSVCLADIAIFPFIRQAANVDMEWFRKEYVNLARWLERFVRCELFESVMAKYSIWEPGSDPRIINFSK